MTQTAWAPGERARLTALATLLGAAMLSPLRQHLRPRDEQTDSYPLSFYPMFRRLRRQRVTISHAVGIHVTGERRYLTGRVLIAGAGFNQARRQLNRAVRQGRADAYAEKLAARVADDPRLSQVVRVDIVNGVFDLDSCLLDGAVVCEEIESVHGSAPVADRPQPTEAAVAAAAPPPAPDPAPALHAAGPAAGHTDGESA